MTSSYKKMKVLIVAANREKYPDPVFPLGAAYIAQAAEDAGYDTAIFDACFSDNPAAELGETVKKNCPDVVALSMRNIDDVAFPHFQDYLPYYKELVQAIRKTSGVRLVLGGSAFTIFPQEYLAELGADYGIAGEGEYAFITLLKQLSNNSAPSEKLIYSEKIRDINTRPYPLRKGFAVEMYYERSGCLNIQSKRGCALKCCYCTYPVIEGSAYRLRSAASVAEELSYWANRGIKYFFFVDSTFNYPENYARDVALEIIRLKLNIHWTGFFAPKISSPEFVDICLESGLTSMDLGTDAFSSSVLKGFKKNYTVDDIFHACNILTEKKVKFNHSLIFGGPGETYATMEETIRNVDKTAPVSNIAFLGIRVYPNTAIAAYMPPEVQIGLKPVFYFSETVKDGMVPWLVDRLKNNRKWLIPGTGQGTNFKLFEHLRRKGQKGPLWELL